MRHDGLDEATDRLVRQVLDAEAERVDADAFVARVHAARRRGRLVRLSVRLAVAAAAVLAVCLVVLRDGTGERPADLEQQGRVAVVGLQSAVEAEMAAAWRAARYAAGAAVDAGTEPLRQLAEVRTGVSASVTGVGVGELVPTADVSELFARADGWLRERAPAVPFGLPGSAAPDASEPTSGEETAP